MPESVYCETCDFSPRWAHYRQCFGCLYYHVKPCDYVPLVGCDTDLSMAMVQIRQRCREWEALHPRWVLVPDYQRVWPESAAPSRHADYATSIGRKFVHSRFKVERRHPRGQRLRSWQQGMMAFHHPHTILWQPTPLPLPAPLPASLPR